MPAGAIEPKAPLPRTPPSGKRHNAIGRKHWCEPSHRIDIRSPDGRARGARARMSASAVQRRTCIPALLGASPAHKRGIFSSLCTLVRRKRMRRTYSPRSADLVHIAGFRVQIGLSRARRAPTCAATGRKGILPWVRVERCRCGLYAVAESTRPLWSRPLSRVTLALRSSHVRVAASASPPA